MATTEQLKKAMYLYKIALDDAARKAKGSLTFLNQHTVLWGVQKQRSHNLSLFKKDGVCAGLTVAWIKSTLSGKNFMADLENARNDIFANGKKGLQESSSSLLTEVGDAHLLQVNLVKAFAGVGVKASTNVYDYPFNNASRCFQKGCFYYISTGGHATGVICHGSKIDFYDPNVGLVKGANKNIIDNYMKRVILETKTLVLGQDASSAKGKQLTITGFKPV